MIDAYSGVGTISLIVADQVKEVIGVEINNDGVKDAVMNAKRNNINNVRFHRADAGKFMVELAMKNEAIDAVIMYPPSR
ncbi:methyltransferase domain-containing protein [Sporosarcina sp. A2]|uniref:methyltransferase domain-containing protein n=1 Tax=Sporosarcina sp. A2 TaxID=3393449 RepID=UPI003D798CC8